MQGLIINLRSIEEINHKITNFKKITWPVIHSEKFTFVRLRYRSGDWDTDQRMPSNLLNSLIEYTTIPVTLQEKIIDLSSNEIFHHPFCYISGHKLVQFDS